MLYTGTLLRSNVVLKFTAKRCVLANTEQCVGRGKECAIEQRNQNTDIPTHTVSKEKCQYAFLEKVNGEEHREFLYVSEEYSYNVEGLLN